MKLTNEDVEDIIRLLDSSYYNELRVKTDKFDLYLRRAQSGWTQEMRTLTRPDLIGGTEPAAASAPSESETSVTTADHAEGLHPIRAPMVGTFYRAPKPGASPFVDIGSAVSEDTVICIVETMKLMNSISAGASGTVAEILVADGQLVESGQILMLLQQVEP